MALFVSGDVEQSLRVVRAGADHSADDPVRPNLLYLHVLAFLGSVVLGEDETLEAIGLIEASSAPGIRAGGSWVRANLLAGRDAPAAIALYQAKVSAPPESRRCWGVSPELSRRWVAGVIPQWWGGDGRRLKGVRVVGSLSQ